MKQDNPRNDTGRLPGKDAGWALGLGLGAVLVVPLLGTLNATLRRLLDPVSVNPGNQSILGGGGLAVTLLSLALSVAALAAGIRALRAGARSWAVWAGLLLALLVMGFWLFWLAGEIVYPH